MTRRRGQNEGSIFKRVDGRWEGRLNLGWRNGKRRSKSFYGNTREEVARLLADAKSQHDKGVPVPMGRETVGAFLDGWLAGVRPSVRPRTWESYELYVRRHTKPVIGKKKFSALRPEHLRDLLSSKLSEGLSPQSVVHLRTILNTALRQAVADRLLAWNPMSSVKRRRLSCDHFDSSVRSRHERSWRQLTVADWASRSPLAWRSACAAVREPAHVGNSRDLNLASPSSSRPTSRGTACGWLRLGRLHGAGVYDPFGSTG
jgi:hypothetical protein